VGKVSRGIVLDLRQDQLLSDVLPDNTGHLGNGMVSDM
jgi:hypothetical protein